MNSKLNNVKLTNFGMIPEFSCEEFSNINLIIGENGTGKTFLLKALYSATRAMEEYRRGDDISTINDLLANKLRWTYQVDKLGDIVSKSSDNALTFEATLDNEKLEYQFTQSAISSITKVTGPKKNRNANSIFIPAKEVLSLFPVILKSREVDKSFGFDDTYYDLAKALRIPLRVNQDNKDFEEAQNIVHKVIDGKVELDDASGKWYYKNNRNQKFSIGATSEGVKKISILDRLISNRYISSDSIIFIDELESALHPAAICTFLDMIDILASKLHIQFFITSHSYFVIKKLALIATNKKKYVNCISLAKDQSPVIYDMSESMPKNSIIDTSIQLYKEEVEKVLS